MENLDDPRTPHTELKTDADFQARRGLSAIRFGVTSLEELRERQLQIALELQTCSSDPRHYRGWQGRFRRLLKRISARRRG